MFFKSLCRVLLMTVIRARWTGPLPSCRFRGEAAGFHSPPKPQSCFFPLSVWVLLVLISVANLSSRRVERVRWSSSQLIELLYKPCFLCTMQKALFNRGEVLWQAPEVISVYGEAIWIEFLWKKSHIYVDICRILAHIIIEVSKFGYFIFPSFIYWHGLIQTQIDYLNLCIQVDLNVKTKAYCYFLFTGIKCCVAVKEMYNSNPVWTSLLLSASIVQGLNNQCERIEETHRNV